ncbi:MAG: hypothetical protein ALECFALPRED_003502 [Alectoria fallacina]|uniref:Uncharacterized protein n=1 Tax=Alectoria fallacina TaxID=1903189 RepID=A0A8H3FKA6_9LECA|nr:MAG: hypothetical protein ALECFALPRED_003502 [Alectoria fallacina]
MAESSPIKSSAMTSNIDIAVATTSPSSKPSQTASTEPPQTSTENNERDQKTDEEEIIEPRIPQKEALVMLQRLRLYEEQQDNGDPTMITRLNRYESTIRGRLIVSYNKQADITSFFTRKDN